MKNETSLGSTFSARLSLTLKSMGLQMTEQISRVDERTADKISKCLISAVPGSASVDSALEALWNQATPLDPSLDQAPGELSRVLAAMSVELPEHVYAAILDYRGDVFEKVCFELLDRFFDDFWYPATSECAVVDGSFRWVLVIHHEGYVNLKHT